MPDTLTFTDEQIQAIKKNPNTPMVTNKQLAQLIENGTILYAEIEDKLKPARKAQIENLLNAGQNQQQMETEYERIKGGIGITLEDMEAFVDKYPGTTEAEAVKALITNKLIAMEHENFKKCVSIDDFQKFKATYPHSSHLQEANDKIQQLEQEAIKADDNAWRKAESEGTTESVTAYWVNPEYKRHKAEAQALLTKLKAQQEAQQEEYDWQQARNSNSESALRAFIDKYPSSTHKAEAQELIWDKVKNSHSIPALQTFIDTYPGNAHVSEAKALIQELIDYPNIRTLIDNTLSDPNSDVDNYVHLMQRFPSFREEIRQWMLSDMKSHPERYQRHEMAALIYGGDLIFTDKGNAQEHIDPYFTRNEILDNGILSERRLNWIFSHRTIKQDHPSVELPIEDDFSVEPNTTDVYFFGVPGCGKTSVMAGLFSTTKIDDGLNFSVLMKGCRHKGFNYANLLTSSLQNEIFPLSTPTIAQRMGEAEADNEKDDAFIQIIDARLTEKKKKDQSYEHNISLIEMPGARTNQLAAMSEPDADLLGKGAVELLTNENNKVVFFVIDPNSKRRQSITLHGQEILLTQAQILQEVANLLKIMLENQQLKNLKAVHVIMAKADLLPDYKEETIQKVIREGGYAAFINTLEEICSKRLGEVNVHCKRQPHLFTFSLGQIAPGDFVTYKKADTNKLLKVICANTVSMRQKGFIDIVMDWMNQ